MDKVEKNLADLPAELTIETLARGMLTLEQVDFNTARGLLKKGLENLIGNEEISNQTARTFKKLLKQEKDEKMKKQMWVVFPTQKILEILEEIGKEVQFLFQENLRVAEYWRECGFDVWSEGTKELWSYDLYAPLREVETKSFGFVNRGTLGVPIVSVLKADSSINVLKLRVNVYHPKVAEVVEAKFEEMNSNKYQPQCFTYDEWSANERQYNVKSEHYCSLLSILNYGFGLFGKEIRNKKGGAL